MHSDAAGRVAQRWLDPSIVLLPALAPWLVLPALLAAGFSGDDWSFLAQARHRTGPLEFFLHDHSYTYMYRPVGMALWWLSTAVFGIAPAGHYALDLLLHGLAAALVASLVRSSGAHALLALACGVAFALHPVAAATVSWLADRFDLLGTLACLAALRLLPLAARRPRLAAAGLVLAAIVAAGSKESTIVLVPAVCAWLLVQRVPLQRAAVLAALVALPFAAMLLARVWVLGSLGGVAAESADPLTATVDGVRGWILHLPVALATGQGPGTAAGLAGLLAAVVLICVAALRGTAGQRALLAASAVLLLGAVVLQAPVAGLVLAASEPFGITTNLRFYYLPLAALLVALGAAGAPRRGSGARADAPALLTGGLLLLLTAALWAPASRVLAREWRQFTAAPALLATQRAAAAGVIGLAGQLRDGGAGTPCVIVLERLAWVPDLHGFADVLVKAQLAPGDPALACIVLGAHATWIALTPADAPAPAVPQRQIGGGRRGPQRSGSLWFHFPADEAPAGASARLRWDGEAFVPEPPVDGGP